MSDHDVLGIKQLSEFLMVSEKTIYRMLEKKRLPASRIGAQWRFRKRDIDTWLDDQVRNVDVEGNRSVLDDLEQSEIDIAALLELVNIWLNLAPGSRDDVLLWMVTNASIDEGVDRQALYESMRERETLCSTALVHDAAFPHPNQPAAFRFSRKRVLLATLEKPIDFADRHGHRPRVIAMILARTTPGYLLTISRAIKLFSDHHLIEQLTNARNTEAVVHLIRAVEARLTVPTL